MRSHPAVFSQYADRIPRMFASSSPLRLIPIRCQTMLLTYVVNATLAPGPAGLCCAQNIAYQVFLQLYFYRLI